MEKSLFIIKPDAVSKNLVGPIISSVESAGFRITAIKMLRLSREEASEFYAVHRGKPFYDGLLDFISSGRIVVAVLEREDGVRGLREIIGATDPAEAAEGTIRKAFAEDVQRNAVHASDSRKNALKEVAFFFSQREILVG